MKVLITGGSSGLGKSILETISLSHEVHFTYNNSIKSANDITNRFKNAFSYKCDFTDEIQLKDFLNKIKNIDFDVLINNYYSGNFLGKHFSKTDSSDFLDVYKNNIIPVIEITQVLIETFKKKKKGMIISISSESIVNPPIGTCLYSTVKSVIEQLSKIWNSENKRFGIKSKIISPSFMRTKLTSDIDDRIIEMYFETESNFDEIKNVSNEISKLIDNDF